MLKTMKKLILALLFTSVGYAQVENKELDTALFRFGCCCIVFIGIAVIIAVGWGFLNLLNIYNYE